MGGPAVTSLEVFQWSGAVIAVCIAVAAVVGVACLLYVLIAPDKP